MIFHHTRSYTAVCLYKMQVVLAMGQGDPQAVRIRTAETVRFGYKPVQKPDLLHIGWPNPNPYPSTHGFLSVWLSLSIAISGSSFRGFLLMVTFRYPIANRKYWHWYIIVLFWCIGCLYNQKQVRHATCPILKMRVNGESLIFGLASWVMCVAIWCRCSYMRYWLHL